MPRNFRQHLLGFLRSEAVALLSFQRSDRPWQLPFAAAFASGIPVAAGAYFGLRSAGALGAVAGLSFLYLPATSLRHRIPIIMACAFAMLSSYAIGLASQAMPGGAVLVITFIAAVATLFCKTQAVVPPGPIFMVMAGAIAASSPVQVPTAVQNLGFFALGCIWACIIAVAYSAHVSRRPVPIRSPSPLRTNLEAVLVDSILIGAFVGASLAVSALLGLQKVYWVPVSCLAVMQGVSLRASWSRNVHRIVGTAIGLGLTWVLLPFLTNGWAIAIAVTLLTFLIETAVVRHYAFAAMFITPLTILLAESSAPNAASAGTLMQTRLMDTAIGAMIGLAGAACLHNNSVRRFVGRGIAVISRRNSPGER